MRTIRENNDSPIDEAISSIRSKLFPNFVKKWSSHCHPENESYKKTITIVGIWKCTRAKCCYDNGFIRTDFGDIQTGCLNSPSPLSYNCKTHKKGDLSFQVFGRLRSYKPRDIVATKLINCKQSLIYFK